MKHETIAFMPGVGGSDALARYWLRQVTLRLRREVCWLWREWLAQSAAASPGLPGSAGSALPPFVDPALGSLDLARYAQDKQDFFGTDIAARYLSERLAEPLHEPAEPPRGGFGWAVRELRLAPVEAFVLGLALLPAVDSAAGAVVAACLNDPSRVEPTLALAQRLWDEPDRLLICADPGHALFSHGLLAPAAAHWHAPLQMPAQVAREVLFPHAASNATTGRRRLIPILGAAGAPMAEAAAHAAARTGMASMQPAAAPGADHLRALMTEAWLRGAALYLPLAWLQPPDAPAHDGLHAPLAMPLPALPLTLFVGLHERSRE